MFVTRSCVPLILVTTFAGASGVAGQDGEFIRNALEGRSQHYAEVAQEIWNLAEVGYLEVESSRLLQTTLSQEGFEIETGVAGIPPHSSPVMEMEAPL